MAPCIAEDASFLRLETEEESETYAGKEVAYPAFRGILCSEHMIHLIGREVKKGLRRHLIENAFGIRTYIEHTKIDEAGYTETSIQTVAGTNAYSYPNSA